MTPESRDLKLELMRGFYARQLREDPDLDVCWLIRTVDDLRTAACPKSGCAVTPEDEKRLAEIRAFVDGLPPDPCPSKEWIMLHHLLGFFDESERARTEAERVTEAWKEQWKIERTAHVDALKQAHDAIQRLRGLNE